MIITPAKLADFYSTHNHDAETCIAHWLAAYSGWELVYAPARVNFPDWDFVLVDPVSKAAARGEIKISSKGPMGGFLELSRGNGDPSGLSATRADFYLFLNAGTGNRGKVRLSVGAVAVETGNFRYFFVVRRYHHLVEQTRLQSRFYRICNNRFAQKRPDILAGYPFTATTGRYDCYVFHRFTNSFTLLITYSCSSSVRVGNIGKLRQWR